MAQKLPSTCTNGILFVAVSQKIGLEHQRLLGAQAISFAMLLAQLTCLTLGYVILNLDAKTKSGNISS